MLLELARWLTPYVSAFHVVQYLTFRAIMATLTALVVSLLVGPGMIRRLAALKAGQVIRQDGPQSHLSKAGTPTMGGALILASIASVGNAGALWNPRNGQRAVKERRAGSGWMRSGMARDDVLQLERLRQLRMAVRVDRPGRAMRDLHTVGAGTFRGRPHGMWGLKDKTVVTQRYYLVDAAFTVALAHDDQGLVEQIARALSDPVWPLFLGREVLCSVRADSARTKRRHARGGPARCSSGTRDSLPTSPGRGCRRGPGWYAARRRSGQLQLCRPAVRVPECP